MYTQMLSGTGVVHKCELLLRLCDRASFILCLDCIV